MSAADLPRHRRRRSLPARRQGGASAVEFGLLVIVFFSAVFGIVETTRMVYMFNTLQEVTRRAAAAAVHIYPSDSDAIARLKQEAIFRTSPGTLLLTAPVSDASIRIDYLALTRDPAGKELAMTPIAPGALAPTAARNRQICMGNPNAANCIRFVKVQVCDSAVAGHCVAPRSQLLTGLLDIDINLHKATTIAPVASFGYVPGSSPCPCP